MNTLPDASPLNSIGWMKLVNNYVGGEPPISKCNIMPSFNNRA